MASSTIKSTAIPLSGYIYQNLIGLELLLGWLEAPASYQWVEFEADDDQIPSGLDDIKIMKGDNTLACFQVKFTVDPNDEKNALDWKWLLAHKKRGKSLIQKWQNALQGTSGYRVTEAALITNRIPNLEFSKCLSADQRFVNFDAIPDDIKETIVEQLSSVADAKTFFSALEIRHSHQSYLSLNRTLLNNFIRIHTDIDGWNALQVNAVDWAIRKSYPPPKGRITLDLIRGVLDSRRPKPILQSFRVPDGYAPPDDDFTKMFLERLLSAKIQHTVLWGSPGQGKSTFISFACSSLEVQGIPYIRHHYFLNISDNTDRLTYPTVVNSLMHQMELRCPEYIEGLTHRPEDLRKWIEAAAEGCSQQGKPFIVFVDGLDHVWRDNERNKQPLDSLFNELFPLPTNLVLVVGTQRVSEEQLPRALTESVAIENWIELPRMSAPVVKNWLEQQLLANRFLLPERQSEYQREPLSEIAAAFYEISLGHPLHLTYSFEYLAREKRILTKEDIEAQPPCPDGDIRNYYRRLWQSLPHKAKDALHLVADAEFIWPQNGLEFCLGLRFGELNREIGHLFHLAEAGLIAFHGSILAFVRDDGNHSRRISELLPTLLQWLNTSAPTYHRWGWSWLTEARLGDKAALVNGPSKAWIIESLKNAYPVEQIKRIISAAEKTVFEVGDYPRAVRLHRLNQRLEYSIEYQGVDYDRVLACALTLTPDPSPFLNMHARVESLSVRRLAILSRQFLAVGRDNDALRCLREMREQINQCLEFDGYNRRDLQKDLTDYFSVAALTKDYKVDGIEETLRGFSHHAQELLRVFLRNLSQFNDLSLLVPMLKLKLGVAMKADVENAIIRVAGTENAEIHLWTEFQEMDSSFLSSCWAALYQEKFKQAAYPISNLPNFRSSDADQRREIESHLHQLFFSAVTQTLELRGAKPHIQVNEAEHHPWLNDAVGKMVQFGYLVGARLSRREDVPFSFCYRLLDEISRPKAYSEHQDYLSFCRAIDLIACDVFCLTNNRTRLGTIPFSAWELVCGYKSFDMDRWISAYLTLGRQLVDPSHLSGTFQKIVSEDATSRNFGERAERSLEYCELAIEDNSRELAALLLNRAVKELLGYGQHKDMFVFSLLDSVAAVAAFDPVTAKQHLLALAPAITQIDDFTDGDEVNYAKYQLAALLLEYLPEIYVKYYGSLVKNEQWYPAEMVLTQLLKRQALNAPLMPVLTCALSDEHTIGALRQRARAGEASAQSIIEKNAVLMRKPVEELGKERYSSTSSEETTVDVDVEAYGPEGLDKLLQDISEGRSYFREKSAIRKWFDTFKSAGRGLELLETLRPHLAHRRISWGIAPLLDDAFLLSLSLEGKTKAFPWLVAAQLHADGWGSFNSESQAMERFSLVSRHYKGKWEEFLRSSARNRYSEPPLDVLVPQERLVQFLVAVGQTQLALDATAEMVVAFLEDVADANIDFPDWLQEAM